MTALAVDLGASGGKVFAGNFDGERLSAYMQKAAREAKAYTSWLNPDPAYEAALADFVAAVQAAYGVEPLGQVDHVVRAVIDLLDSHVTAGEMKDVREAFTKEIRALFGVG